MVIITEAFPIPSRSGFDEFLRVVQIKRPSKVSKYPHSSEPAKRNAAFEPVIEESNEHYFQLQCRMAKVQEEGSDVPTTQNPEHFGALIHHLSLIRNKRCLMAYMFNRAQKIQRLRWKHGAVLPVEIQKMMSYSEKEFFKNYSDTLGSYMTEVDLDLSVDTDPPKDPYVKVRIANNVGDIMVDDQAASLISNSIHMMKRSEADSLLSLGVLEELIG